MCKILVIGLGNVLMSDDGLGVVAIHQLQEKSKAYSNIFFLDVGTSIFNHIADLGKSETLIVIDAIKAGYPPGTIYRIDDFDTVADIRRFYNSHGFTIIEAIALSRELTGLPQKATIFGIEPYSCDLGYSVSREIRGSLIKLINMVEREIESLITPR
ncbi:MAG: hydrogenase maturation protease [Tepidanaerobacteraceae bacterium]|nr:hydrogenase maturation protease [Thermoanaerobacterales bacterium]